MPALAPITADPLAAPHGFFTRQGGVSTGRYDSLNCGPGSDDAAEAVAENRARVAASVGVGGGAGAIVSVHQVHSADAVIVEAPFAEKPRADGMATKTPGLALGVLVADCAPVLFEDASAGVVGAAHAGWRGALGGVTGATLAAMETLGADRAHIQAVIGPCISQRAYEVGPEFMDAFLADDQDNARFFAGGQGDRMHFDLPGYLLTRLRAEGAAGAAWTGHCTYSDPAKFFSYRRTTHEGGGDYGRLVAAIAVKD